MGLAPAPHLGGAEPPNAVLEAEARKQRVLARIASGDGRPRTVTGPPPPTQTGPPPPNNVSTARPPPAQPKLSTDTAPSLNAPQKRIIEETYVGPPAAFGQTTLAITTPIVPLTLPRAVSSDGRLPAASGWDVHNAADAEVDETEVMEAAPNTARMRAAFTPPMDQPMPAPPRTQIQSESPHNTSLSSPPIMGAQTAALAIRPYEPPYARQVLSGQVDPRLILITNPHSSRASSFRLLRDSLIAKSMPRVLAVTSAAPHDGKTTCAANLALAMAELASTRVLLIDANFFDPELAQIFGIGRLPPATPPDAESWLAPYKLVEVIASLHVAGMVRGPGEPPPRFEQQRFESIIDRLVRVSYDYIIIDTPALRQTPAVAQLLGSADATLMAVRSGVTTSRDLRRAVEQIPKGKALGVALMDTSPTS